MNFIEAECPNCGAQLQLDNKLEKAFCSHCGSQIIVEKAIELKNTILMPIDERIKNAETFLRLEEYKEAYKAFKEVIKLAPDRHEGWLGLFLTESKKCKLVESSFINSLENALECDNKQLDLEAIKNYYVALLEIKESKSTIATYTRELEDKREKIERIKSSIRGSEKASLKSVYKIIIFSILAIIVFFVSENIFFTIPFILLIIFYFVGYKIADTTVRKEGVEKLDKIIKTYEKKITKAKENVASQTMIVNENKDILKKYIS